MRTRPTPTQVSLRGSLCRDLLALVAAGMSANEAASRLISELLNADDAKRAIRVENGVFVFERREAATLPSTQSRLFQ
jgi:hypothetical protein